MSLYTKVRGTIESIFQIGLSGPQIKDNAGVIEAKNAADSGFVIVRGAAPVGENDFATKNYVDAIEGTLIVSRQANTSASIPNNTATRGFVVVTTAGSGANIGDVLFDDGSSSGLMEILVASENRSLFITDALVGGTVSFNPDSLYTWDEDGVLWVKIGDIASLTGPLRVVRFAITNAATQDSSFSLPANVRIFSTRVEIATSYSGGATIQIGQPGNLNLLQDTGDNNPQVTNIYEVEDDIAWGGSDNVVRVTIAGAPAAGDGFVVVMFSNPNA